MTDAKAPELITDVQERSGMQVFLVEAGLSYSTARQIPYAEAYRDRTGLIATPMEELQRAAEDEAARGSED
jgi:hypothetical protein